MVSPLGRVEFIGVTPIDTSVAVVTVSVMFADTVPRVAATVLDPGLNARTSPADPAALLTEATAELEELQVTALVRSCVELSL